MAIVSCAVTSQASFKFELVNRTNRARQAARCRRRGDYQPPPPTPRAGCEAGGGRGLEHVSSHELPKLPQARMYLKSAQWGFDERLKYARSHLYSQRGGLTDDRIHASTDVRPIARCLRYGRPAPINSDANPATKRPNAIHSGCMVNLVGRHPSPS
jgi:hypothetical protein